MQEESIKKTKFCKHCKKEKSIDKFYKDKYGLYGVHSLCKECKKKQVVENRIKKSEYMKSIKEGTKEFIESQDIKELKNKYIEALNKIKELENKLKEKEPSDIENKIEEKSSENENQDIDSSEVPPTSEEQQEIIDEIKKIEEEDWLIEFNLIQGKM